MPLKQSLSDRAWMNLGNDMYNIKICLFTRENLRENFERKDWDNIWTSVSCCNTAAITTTQPKKL